MKPGSILLTMSRLGLYPGLSFFKRKLSIGFDVETIGGTRRIRMEEFVRFLRDDCKIRPANMNSLQIHPISPYCFVGLPSEEILLECWDRIKDGVTWTGKGDVASFLCTDSYTEVKLKGVAPGTEEGVISNILGFYGEVISCKEFRTKMDGVGGAGGAASGDFLLRMKLSHPIPRLMPEPADGDVWVCYYEGQEDSCWKCMAPGHMTRDCRSPFNKEFIQEQRDNRNKLFNPIPRVNGGGDEDVNADAVEEDGEENDNDREQEDEGRDDELPVIVVTEPENLVPEGLAILALAGGVGRDNGEDVFLSTPQDCEHAPEGSLFTPGHTQMLNRAMDEAERKLNKKERQREKRRQSNLSSSSLPETAKKTKAGSSSLQPVQLGEERDRRRGSTDSMNVPVPRVPMITPADRLKLNLATRSLKK